MAGAKLIPIYGLIVSPLFSTHPVHLLTIPPGIVLLNWYSYISLWKISLAIYSPFLLLLSGGMKELSDINY